MVDWVCWVGAISRVGQSHARLKQIISHKHRTCFSCRFYQIDKQALPLHCYPLLQLLT
jgi:hypothetical protein